MQPGHRLFIKPHLFLLMLLSILFPSISFSGGAVKAPNYDTIWRANPVYIGVLGGWGSTDWRMLVPKCHGTKNDITNCKNLIDASAPLSAGDSGFIWGATAGYEIQPHFAIEGTVIRFPDTTITFNKVYNFYTKLNNIDDETIRSITWAYYLVAKFMVQIGNTPIRGFANAGPELTYRKDILADCVRINPTFGVGLDYLVAAHAMVEIGFQYIAGYGESNTKPASCYIPFLYSLHLKLMARI
jgi:hypothetical protein